MPFVFSCRWSTFPLAAGVVLACVETNVASRTDTPATLRRVADALEQEHFGGTVYVERPVPGKLRVVVRDPSRCGDSAYDRARYAVEIAQRALVLHRPPPLQRLTPIQGVDVILVRTHRLGPLVWTTGAGHFAFGAPLLRARGMQPSMSCGGLPSLLKRG